MAVAIVDVRICERTVSGNPELFEAIVWIANSDTLRESCKRYGDTPYQLIYWTLSS